MTLSVFASRRSSAGNRRQHIIPEFVRQLPAAKRSRLDTARLARAEAEVAGLR